MKKVWGGYLFAASHVAMVLRARSVDMDLRHGLNTAGRWLCEKALRELGLLFRVAREVREALIE